MMADDGYMDPDEAEGDDLLGMDEGDKEEEEESE